MSLTGKKTHPLLSGTLASTGPWAGLFARAGFRIYPFQLGGMVRTTSTGTTVSTFGLGQFEANDYIIFCDSTAYGSSNLFIPNLNKIRRISSISTSDDQITIDSAVSITAGDYILCIGADTSLTPESSPNYDGSDIVLYTDNVGITASAFDYVQTSTSGTFLGWTGPGTKAVDLLVTNSSGVPQIVIPFHPVIPNEEVNQILTLATAGATPNVGGFKVLKITQSGATAITNLTNGTIGQEVTLLFTDANSTIADSAPFKLNGAFASAADSTLKLVYDGTSWWEISRQPTSGGSATIIAETSLAGATLSGTAASIDLTSLDQTYDDLILRLWGRTDRSATSDTVGLTFNNDTTDANYRNVDVSGTGSTAASAENDDRSIGRLPAASSTASDFGWIEVVIPAYTTAQRKTCRSNYGRRADATTVTSGHVTLNWENTAAITRITIVSLTSSNFDTGTRYQLVGRKSTSV